MSASFSARSVPPGRYDLKIRVSDGAPYPKFVDKVITINVKKPEPREEPKKEEPKEVKRLIDRATVSTITAIVQDKDGNERVWLDDKIGGKKYRLGVGDKFEIGSVSGVIKSIKKNVVEVEVASGKVVTYRLGDKLSKPQPDKSL